MGYPVFVNFQVPSFGCDCAAGISVWTFKICVSTGFAAAGLFNQHITRSGLPGSAVESVPAVDVLYWELFDTAE